MNFRLTEEEEECSDECQSCRVFDYLSKLYFHNRRYTRIQVFAINISTNSIYNTFYFPNFTGEKKKKCLSYMNIYFNESVS